MIGETLELDSVSKIDEFLGKPMKYRKIANRALETRSDLINTKVKLLGGYTSDVTLDWLFRFSAGFGIKLDIEKSPWGPAYALAASMNHANEDASVLYESHNEDLIFKVTKIEKDIWVEIFNF